MGYAQKIAINVPQAVCHVHGASFCPVKKSLEAARMLRKLLREFK
jgi:hypothetical protein